jgi:hypothetical protein
MIPPASMIGTDFIPTAYQLAAMTILAAWSPALYILCARFGRRAASFVLLLAFVTSFFLFNTVYTWPKMLSAAYVLLALWLLIRIRRGDRAPFDLTLVALCATLSYMSHGGTAFVLLPLALTFTPTILRCGIRQIVTASLAAIACTSPWLWWQTFVQPHGNALLSYALTNDFGFDRRTELWQRLIALYRSMTLDAWLRQKLQSLVMISGWMTDWQFFGDSARNYQGSPIGGWRVLDQFIMMRSIGIASLGAVIAVWRASRRTALDCAAMQFIAIGAASVALTLAATLYYPLTIALPYGGLMLIFIGGALALSTLSKWRRLAVAAAAVGYFVPVWIIHPAAHALRLNLSALAAAAVFAIALVKMLSSPNERPLTAPLPHPTDCQTHL